MATPATPLNKAGSAHGNKNNIPGRPTKSSCVRMRIKITKLMGSMYPRPALATKATGVISKELSRVHSRYSFKKRINLSAVQSGIPVTRPVRSVATRTVTERIILHPINTISLDATIVDRRTGRASISLITLSENSLPKHQLVIIPEPMTPRVKIS